MYLLVIVLSNIRKLKPLVKSLKDIGIKGITVIDSVGSTSIENNYYEYRPIIGSALESISQRVNYKKTLLSVVHCENHVLEAMDLVEKLLGDNLQKPNTGIVFTIPVKDFRGGALQRYLESQNCSDEHSKKSV